ncbi:hypothetical protein SLA2020_383620 [Shorea laevis]
MKLAPGVFLLFVGAHELNKHRRRDDREIEMVFLGFEGDQRRLGMMSEGLKQGKKELGVHGCEYMIGDAGQSFLAPFALRERFSPATFAPNS